MSVVALRELLARLNTSAGALAVLGAAIDARLGGVPIDPTLRPHVDEIIDALGVRAELELAGPTELRAMLGEIRSATLTHAKLVYVRGRRPGWSHEETELLQAAGDVSVGLAHALAHTVAPQLPGLVERLERAGASFLDIGAGVAALAIEMAQLWPRLSVVGLEPWGPSLALARENVARAGLQARVEIREQAGEDLAGHDRYDLAWIPGAFLPGNAVRATVERVLQALRPGGWLLFALASTGDELLEAALARFRTVMFGGQPTTSEAIEGLLARAGFVELRTVRIAAATLVAGRRRPA